MPRQDRLDFKGAIHYARLRGRDGAAIFFEPAILTQTARPAHQQAPHLQRFERLMIAAGEECLVVLHGYCMEPNSCLLVLQTNGPALEAFMRRLCGQHSRYLRRNAGLAHLRRVFAARYESKVIAPEYLPHAVRRAHRAPIVSGLCQRRVDYPFSSERAYAGERADVPLDTSAVRKALELRGLFGLRGYRDFMDQAETPYVRELFRRGSPLDSRIVGSKQFAQRARDLAAHPPLQPTRDQLVAGVARLIDASESAIHSRTHTGVLGRALVAWYAHRAGSATIAGVGQWFGVTGAALGQGIRHYRAVAPELFSLSQLPGIDGLPAAQQAARDNGSDDSR